MGVSRRRNGQQASVVGGLKFVEAHAKSQVNRRRGCAGSRKQVGAVCVGVVEKRLDVLKGAVSLLLDGFHGGLVVEDARTVSGEVGAEILDLALDRVEGVGDQIEPQLDKCVVLDEALEDITLIFQVDQTLRLLGNAGVVLGCLAAGHLKLSILQARLGL